MVEIGTIMAGVKLAQCGINCYHSSQARKANKEQQEKNQQFQEALQQKQWKHAEKLQKEMREMTRCNLLEQLKFQQQNADLQDLAQRWPLPSSSPRMIINEFNEYLEAVQPIPLQLIVVVNGELSKGLDQQIRKAFNELNKFMSLHYSQNSSYAVKIYDTCKAGAVFGAAEVHTVFEVFKVAPTMILTARVEGGMYVLECWHWGSGAMQKPALLELFRCDIEELQLSVLNEVASEWQHIKTLLHLEDPDKDALVNLLGRIDAEKKRLEKNGATPQQVREYAYKPFLAEIAQFISPGAPAVDKARRINAAPFIKRISEGIEKSILSSYKICSSLLADAHFLLEYKAAPRFLQVCADELREVPQLMNSAEEFFASAMEAIPAEQGDDRALMYARLATVYQDAEQPEKALKYCRYGSQQLEKLVEPSHFTTEANASMISCLDELRRIPGAEEQVPWIFELEAMRHAPEVTTQSAAPEAASESPAASISQYCGLVEQAVEELRADFKRIPPLLVRADMNEGQIRLLVDKYILLVQECCNARAQALSGTLKEFLQKCFCNGNTSMFSALSISQDVVSKMCWPVRGAANTCFDDYYRSSTKSESAGRLIGSLVLGPFVTAAAKAIAGSLTKTSEGDVDKLRRELPLVVESSLEKVLENFKNHFCGFGNQQESKKQGVDGTEDLFRRVFGA